MNTLTFSISQTSNPAQDLLEARIQVQRNSIGADLRDLARELNVETLIIKREREELDPTSLLILQWHQTFIDVLTESPSPQSVLDEFKSMLQEILVDSIFNSALDEYCLLGSDGGTYSEIGLQVYRSNAPLHLQNSAPLAPDQPLQTSPHDAARCMVRWLSRRNVVHRNNNNEILERALGQLNLTASRIPAVQDDDMVHIMQHQAERRNRRDREREERVQAHQRALENRDSHDIAMIQGQLQEVGEAISEVAQRQFAEIAALNEEFNAELNELRPAVNALEPRIEELERRERRLEEQYRSIQGEVVHLKQANHQLGTQINELEKAIQKDKSHRFKGICKLVCMVAGSALATYLIACALPASPIAAKVSIVPIKGGLNTQVLVSI